MNKQSYTLVFIAILLVQSSHAQVIDFRARQRNDQKVELLWFFKGDSIITSLERKEDGMEFEKIADIPLNAEVFIDDFGFKPNTRYDYRFTYNGAVLQKKVITYDFSVFDLSPPSDVVFYKADGNIHLYWTDITHLEKAYLVLDQSSNVLDSVGPNVCHVVLEDEGWDELYVLAKGDSIETEKVFANEIAVLDFGSELSDEEPLLTVCPNVKYKGGVGDFSFVDGNVSGFIDFLIQDSCLRNRIDAVKLYSMVHLLTDETIQKLVSFQKEYGKMIAIETGGIRQKNGVDKTEIGEQ
ncbi:MAG: hypothetical protein GY790_08280 [Bacteroidetes bacterium]|nr:hypothetical protein [Bacteroidota bacterium]